MVTLSKAQKVARQQFNQLHAKVKDGFIPVEITYEEFLKLDLFAWEVAKIRHGLPKYQGTSLTALHNAFLIGICGELAVIKHLDGSIEYLELDIGSSASEFNHSDLKKFGYDIGVKTVKSGLAPMVKEKSNSPEVICEVDFEDMAYRNGAIVNIKKIKICGIADIPTLEKYITRDLIYDQENPKYKDRLGFYGYQFLHPVEKDEITAILASAT